jgi:hypothetical protein
VISSSQRPLPDSTHSLDCAAKRATLRNPFSLVLLEDLLVLDAVKEFPASHIRGRNLVLSKMNSLSTVMPHNFTVTSLILLSLYSRIRHFVSCKFNEIFQYILSLYVFMLQYPKLKTVYFFFEWLVNFYRTTQSNRNKLTIFSHRPNKLLSRFDIKSAHSVYLCVLYGLRAKSESLCGTLRDSIYIRDGVSLLSDPNSVF